MFVDRAKITIKSGKGGDGCVSFRKEPFVPAGGPDGGDGGKGADVIFEADNGYRTLMDFRYKRKYEAPAGENGRKKKQYGKYGENLVIKVPPGTIIIDAETELIMKDLAHHGDKLVAARGGKGGKGNVHFTTPVRQAPNFAESGGFPQEREVILELKLIADVGLLGFPNVGKSTLLSVSTSARPKIANYHFTTISPNLGVVEIFDKTFVMADIPGLIEGAHQGQGLGLDFLKHIERNKVLIHVVDVAGTEGRDPIDDFEKINNELKQYSEKLSKKPQIVAANKSDVLEDEEQFEAFKAHVEAKGHKVFKISAATNEGVKELLSEALRTLDGLPEEDVEEYELFNSYQRPEDEEGYRDITVSRDNKVYVLQGKQLEKIFNSTNFNDMESLRYLYKYIKQRGAVDRMIEMGIEEGDIVRIKDYEFEFFE